MWLLADAGSQLRQRNAPLGTAVPCILRQHAAHQGLLFGDPLGMPSYITTLTFITVTLCCFIQFYVSQVLLVHNYYIYGSIEAREQERNNIENP